jgi:hypothetical protein
MKNRLIGTALLTFAGISNGAPTVYTDEGLYLAELARLGYSAVHESFEDDLVWADSRNSIANPGSTPSVVSQAIVWTSNYTENNIATGTVGGSAADGSYAIYSLPHGMTTDSVLYCDSAEDPNIPIECFQNDGLKVASESGGMLYAFGGRFDSNTGIPKITFLLDGVDINANDTDNIDNWQREGDVADNWSFVGVIDEAGFRSAEVRELRGKDSQQVLLFSDDFTLAVNDGSLPPPLPAGSLQFSATGFSVAESGATVTVTVTRTEGSAGAVSVDYASSDGSATAGSDYMATTGTLSFDDGVASQSFNVPILDDTLFEGDETFNLNLSNVTGGANLGTQTMATVTIIEDDPPPPAGSLQFSAPAFNIVESGASVTITVTRTGGSAGDVTVDYASSNGGATAGSDYTATAGTLDYADGVTSQSFSVPILDDSLFEGDETLNLNLSNVSGGASLGTPAAASVAIADDDPPPLQDTNGDGLSDADAIALGLDPNDPDGDTDNDGISDVLEVGVDVGNPLDGDVDGVIDALEPGADAADAMIASGLSLDGGGTVVITTATGETLSGVSAAAATGGPAGINFPFGTVSYTTSADVGGSVPVQLEFSADLPANLALYKVDHAGVYRELPASLWTRVSPRRVDLTLTDGDPQTDLDGVVNASIEDPVAPAEVVPLADSSSGGGGGGGCMISPTAQGDPTLPLLTLAAWVTISRRRLRVT